MTNEDRLKEEVEMCHYHLLGKLADDAADRGLDALQKGYLWLRDHDKWPYRAEGWWKVDHSGDCLHEDSFRVLKKFYIPGHWSKSVFHFLRILAEHIGDVLEKEDPK